MGLLEEREGAMHDISHRQAQNALSSGTRLKSGEMFGQASPALRFPRTRNGTPRHRRSQEGQDCTDAPTMSSASEFEDTTRPSSRRRSSSPDSPRKRPRLRSTDSSRIRKHDPLRRDSVEAKYNDDYRLLFNEHVIQAAARFVDDESVLLYSKQVGSSLWSPKEQAVFFGAVERLGKDDVQGIAGVVGSKSPAEVRDYVILLQDAAMKQGDAKLTLRDISAAIEVGDTCENHLEGAGDALAWYQERLEASLEQERYGEYWLITPSIAENIEHDYNGVARPRSVSNSRGEAQANVGSVLSGYVHPFAHHHS
jgi:RNA polymerase I-specific transcription initiation factor RRN5